MRLISSFLLLIVLSSCGGKGSSSSDALPYTTLSEPAPMTFQNEACESQSFQTMSDFDSVSVYSQIDAESVPVQIPLKRIMNGKKIQSPDQSIISNSIYKFQETYTIDRTLNGGYYLLDDYYYGYNLISNGLDLEACSATSYNRYTYEGVGLNVANSIRLTYKKISELGYSLPAVTLNIVPYIQYEGVLRDGNRDGEKYRQYLTDNASYLYTEKKITFYPQSIEEYNEGNVPFWEMSFVTSHEYGHHIFTELTNYRKYDKSGNKESNIHTCFYDSKASEKLKEQSKPSFFSTRSKDDKVLFALKSINEGFADMIGFYTLDEKLTHLSASECFRINRDIDYGNFQDRTRKIFNYEALSAMDSSIVNESLDTCKTADYQEVHSVGAIFAYVSNSLMDSLGLTKDQKLKVLLDATKKMSEEDFSSLKPSTIIFNTVNSIRDLALKVSEKNYSCEQLKRTHFELYYGYLSCN